MKKGYLFLLTVLLTLSVSLKAQTVLIMESFEEGIPATWMQENIAGEQMWAVEENGTNPDGAFEGTHRLYLRNDKGQTLGYKTRLISPVLDLIGVYQPILRFAFANPKWTADVDTFRVLYRTAEKQDWNVLFEADESHADWNEIIIDLPAVSATYQLAFEGTDNLGRGIVLDKIQVRSKPECTIPHDLFVVDMADSAATFGWQASLDADYFQIVISNKEINPDTLERVPQTNIVLDYKMDADSVTYRFRGLEPGENYFFYCRSICEREISDWGAYAFRMHAAEQLPFTEHFNMPYQSGRINRPSSWTYGANTGSMSPFIPTNIVDKTNELEGYSPDSTRMLAFANGNLSTAIASGQYAYAATPELMGAELKDCQVRFFATVGEFSGLRNSASGIIVGIMTNAEDLTTFEPIDTCYVWGMYTFEEFCVDFTHYKGTGKYVCFMSNFKLPNRLYIDDVVVEKRPAVRKVCGVNVFPKDVEATFTWDGNAKNYNVLVTNTLVANPDNVEPAAIVKKETITGNSYTVKGLEPFHSWNRPYYVYVQAMNSEQEKAEWSYRKPFVTTASLSELPASYTMESSNQNEIYIINNPSKPHPVSVNVWGNYSYPYILGTKAHGGMGTLFLTKAEGCDTWITFPRINEETIKTTQISFYLSGSDSYNTTRIGVGLMTNPMDFNTFTLVEDFTVENAGYTVCYTNFADTKFHNKGEYIALAWLDKNGNVTAYIDDVVIEPISTCVPVAHVDIVSTDNQANISWTQGALEWEVVLSKLALSDMDLAAGAFDSNPNVVYTKIVKNLASDVADNLQPASHYYFYVRPKCGETYAGWTKADFVTQCAPKINIPYLETFSAYGTGKNAFPSCWTAEFPWSYQISDVHCPTVDYKVDHTGNGVGALYMESHSEDGWGACIVSPEIDTPLSDLKLSFYYYANAIDQEIYVGTIADDRDYATFVAIDTFYVDLANTWIMADVDLARYKGNNKRIAFSTFAPEGKHHNNLYIDDIALENNACVKPFAIRATNVHSTDLTIVWGGKTSDKFEIMVSPIQLSLIGNEFGGLDRNKLIVDDTCTENSYFVDNLDMSTTYYVYVRPNCGDMLWAEGTVATECTVINPKSKFVEDFEKCTVGTTLKPVGGPACWITGNGNASASARYKAMPFKSTAYASSGTNVLRFESTTKYTPAWAAAPRIQGDLSKVAVSFVADYSNTTAGRLIFGVMEDPYDLHTFVPIDSLILTTAKQRFEYDLADYKDIIRNAQYIAWRTPIGNTSTVYAFLDDLKVYSNSCPTPNPSVSKVKSNSVVVSSGLRVSMPWRIVVTKEQISADKLDDPMYTIPSDVLVWDTVCSSAARSIIVKNLEEKTDYYVAVSSQCDGNEHSGWALTDFSTLCNPIKMEMLGTVSFEDGENLGCWITGSTAGASEPFLQTGINYAHDGYNSLGFNTTPAKNGAYAISQALDVPDMNKLQLTFYAYCGQYINENYGHGLIIGIVTDPLDMGTFVPVDTVYVTENAYRGFSVSFAAYEGDFIGEQGKHIAFLSEFPVDNYCYIDEISVSELPSCFAPQAVTVDSVGETVVKISWKGFTDTYRVVLSKDEVKDKDKADYKYYVVDTIVSAKEIVIEGLTGGTQYFPYVQAVCSETDRSTFSIDRNPIYTDCPASYPLPYFCDFDHNKDYGTGIMADCWNSLLLNSNVQSYPQVCVEAGRNDSYGLYLFSANTNKTASIAVAPELQTPRLTDYMLSFNARRATEADNNDGSLIIGIVRDINDITNSFCPLDTIMITTAEFRKYYFDFAPYADLLGTTTRIALMTDAAIANLGYNNIYIDNFKVDTPPVCFQPEVEYISSTLNTAVINVLPIEGHAGTNWEVAVMKYADYITMGENDNIETKAVIVNTSDVKVTLTGLDHSTKYVVFARTVCSVGDKSDWSDDIVTFYTKFYYKDSYTFGFERSEAWERSQESISDDFFMHPALQTGFADGKTTYEYYPHCINNSSTNVYARTGEGSLRLKTDFKLNGGYIIFPAIADKVDRCFSFDARAAFALKSNVITAVYPSAGFMIGLIDAGKGLETLKVLGRIDLPLREQMETTCEDNNYLFEHLQFNFTADELEGKQIVLINEQTTRTTCYIDNVIMGPTSSWSTPLISKLVIADTSVTVTCATSDMMNAYVMAGNDAKLDKSKAVVTLLGFPGKAKIGGLDTQSKYTLYIEAANANTTIPAMVSRNVTTSCMAIKMDENSQIAFNFDENISESDIRNYFYPDCWNMLSSSQYVSFEDHDAWTYQFMPTIMRSGFYPNNDGSGTMDMVDGLVCGRNKSASLRFYGSSSYLYPYAVMPLMEVNLDTMQLEFYGRGFTHNNNTGLITDVYYMVGSYTPSVIVGTMTDPVDIATFVPIDTVTYPYRDLNTKTNVLNDPDHLEYWYKFTVPTAGATGNYIAFRLLEGGILFMDDLMITPRKGILPPKGTFTTDVKAYTATANWTRVWQPEMRTIVKLVDEKDNVVVLDTIPSGVMHYDFTNLNASATYSWSIAQTDGTNSSTYSYPENFTTECVPITMDYTCGFEISEGWTLDKDATKDTYKQTTCWVYGNMGTSKSWSTSFPYNIVADSKKSYARTGDYAAYLYAYNTTYKTYIATPALAENVSMDTLQIEFMLRPDPHNPSTGVMATSTYAGTSYAKSVEVGTCTDPHDPTTFAPLQTKTYSMTYTTTTPVNDANNFMFERFIVPLKGAVGPYVYIAATLVTDDNTEKQYNCVYVDDIKFSKYNACDMPTDLKQIDQTISSATVTWNGDADMYVLEVATDGRFTNQSLVVCDTIIGKNTYTVSGLIPNMNYSWRVKAVCGELSESIWPLAAILNTSSVPHFEEDFRMKALTMDWDFATVEAAKAFEGTPMSGVNNANYGWNRTASNFGLRGASYYSPFYSETVNGDDFNYYWMLSPVLYLEEDKPAHLLFSYAFSHASSLHLPSSQNAIPGELDNGHVFMVAVSEDGGKTWNRENATLWSNGTKYGTADYSLTSVLFGSHEARIDLSKYKGKYIRIGFYREATKLLAATCGVHVGNIHINYYEEMVSNQEHCQFEDAEAFNRLYIDGDYVDAGMINLTEYHIVSKEDILDLGGQKADTIYQLNANYRTAPKTEMTDTVCEGTSFTPAGFMPYNKAGVYRLKLTSAVTGCDSIVTLRLGVTPSVRHNEETTLCPGETYNWNGQILTRSGLYVDTTTSLVTGCDSISSLVLTYLNSGDTLTKEVTITEDELPYTYESITYPVGTKPGFYTDTIYVQSGECKGVLIHKLTITPSDALENIIDIQSLSNGVHKLLINEQLYIVRDGEWYDALGKLVSCPL